jgi:benzoate-CoA ligase
MSQAAAPEAGGIFNFAQYIIHCNQARPNKIAFIDDSRALSYGELAQNVRDMAAALIATGLRREERILLLMHDCNEWPVSFLGALYAGLVPVAVNTLLTVDDYAYMLEHSRAQTAIVSNTLWPVLKSAMIRSAHEIQTVIVTGARGGSIEAAPPSCHVTGFESFIATSSAKGMLTNPVPTSADGPGFWLYSSGSTGRPKGTVHTHANLYWTCALYGKAVLGITENDVCFSAAKLYFAYGLGNGLSFPLAVGATVMLMAERPTPDAVFKRWRGEIGGIKPTLFFGAPTGFAGMLASPTLPKKHEIALRLASSAGEALPFELGDRFEKYYGIEIIDGIGSTEMLHVYLSNSPGKVRYGTTGWPVPGYELELRGEDGGLVKQGETGDLYIRGPSAALMYWGNREKTRETFQGAWTKSGDKYVCNEDGSYTYSGRSDDMLKVSGIYVSPFEVESTLMQHASVLEAAVIGVVDSEGLTKAKAFVVLKAGQTASEQQLKDFVKERLAPFKYPRQIQFISELPKTATGKIQRFKLRDLEKTLSQ